jgi:hypothetical protein
VWPHAERGCEQQSSPAKFNAKFNGTEGGFGLGVALGSPPQDVFDAGAVSVLTSMVQGNAECMGELNVKVDN